MVYIFAGISILMFIITVITLRKNSKLKEQLEEVVEQMAELLFAIAMGAIEVEVKEEDEKDE